MCCERGDFWGSCGRVCGVLEGVVTLLDYCCKCSTNGFAVLFSQCPCGWVNSECDEVGVVGIMETVAMCTLIISVLVLSL